MAYFNLLGLFAVYIETGRTLGPVPVFAVFRFNDELIVDIPFFRLILTPGKYALNNRKVGPYAENTGKKISVSFKRASENSS